MPVELGIARAARDSLELCDNLLKTRENTSSMNSPDDTGLVASGMQGVQELDCVGFVANFGWESFLSGHGCWSWMAWEHR